MFESLDVAPPDAILGLADAFQRDPNPQKINLSVGVFKDAQGKTPILQSVKAAESRLLERETHKSYLAIEGMADYGRFVGELLFGSHHEILTTGRSVTLQTPGGTGALRVAADFLKRKLPHARVWHSRPTWANHPSVFTAADRLVETYPYIDASQTGLDFAAMLDGLRKIPSGDVVLLHACCHNPTGIDPTLEQWREIAQVIDDRGLLPLVDFAYQGFGDGLEADAAGLRELCRPGRELLVCSSFSKNFGLYSERVGALTIVAANRPSAEAALSHAKVCVRVNYSNPPQHGAAIVATVLGDADLRAQWHKELDDMRHRIHAMRMLFVRTMQAKTSQRDFSFLARQRGMFSFSGLTPVQVDELRTKHSIYVVMQGGRINVAGMTESNMDRLCDAVAAVL
ncbi:MAG: amino acid aminotransferase [Pirellulaceae bacterium]